MGNLSSNPHSLLLLYDFSQTCAQHICFVCCTAYYLQHAGSLVVACKLLVAACGIQFPDQGSNLGPLHWEHRVLATGPSGKSLVLSFLRVVVVVLEQSIVGEILDAYKLELQRIPGEP